MDRIFIILLNWNGKKDTLECLSSLQKVTYRKFQTVVIDNGSSDDSVAAIRQAFPQIPIFETGENLGFAAGNNKGIEFALRKGADWILLLNNDTIVAPDFLDAFMRAAQEQPQAKILGAKIYSYDAPKTIDHLGGLWQPEMAEFTSNYKGCIDDGISYEFMEKADYVCGAALLMHRSVPEVIGFLEPKFFLFWEEVDFCYRARRAGFETWTAPQAKIWHKISASFTGGKPHTHYFWWRSRLLWLNRNRTFAQRRAIYHQVIFPELLKAMRHLLLRGLQNLLQKPDAARLERTRRLRAGLLGALHYALGRFGNCPASLTRK
ncbi:MAG: glycosyltransferase family 2 protein [Chlamydiia bacterium]|nr:glycosyltransferase family 2 protein [Chlamydiia bacterium]